MFSSRQEASDDPFLVCPFISVLIQKNRHSGYASSNRFRHIRRLYDSDLVLLYLLTLCQNFGHSNLIYSFAKNQDTYAEYASVQGFIRSRSGRYPQVPQLILQVKRLTSRQRQGIRPSSFDAPSIPGCCGKLQWLCRISNCIRDVRSGV